MSASFLQCKINAAVTEGNIGIGSSSKSGGSAICSVIITVPEAIASNGDEEPTDIISATHSQCFRISIVWLYKYLRNTFHQFLRLYPESSLHPIYQQNYLCIASVRISIVNKLDISSEIIPACVRNVRGVEGVSLQVGATYSLLNL